MHKYIIHLMVEAYRKYGKESKCFVKKIGNFVRAQGYM